jgi:hypothetical protein
MFIGLPTSAVAAGRARGAAVVPDLVAGPGASRHRRARRVSTGPRTANPETEGENVISFDTDTQFFDSTTARFDGAVATARPRFDSTRLSFDMTGVRFDGAQSTLAPRVARFDTTALRFDADNLHFDAAVIAADEEEGVAELSQSSIYNEAA